MIRWNVCGWLFWNSTRGRFVVAAVVVALVVVVVVEFDKFDSSSHRRSG